MKHVTGSSACVALWLIVCSCAFCGSQLSNVLSPRSPEGQSSPALDTSHATATDDATAMSPRARSITLAVNFSLTAYSTIITATTKLLNCVELPGTDKSDTFLFVHGSVRCNYIGWQVHAVAPAPHMTLSRSRDQASCDGVGIFSFVSCVEQLPILLITIVMLAAPIALLWLAVWAMRVDRPSSGAVDKQSGADSGTAAEGLDAVGAADSPAGVVMLTPTQRWSDSTPALTWSMDARLGVRRAILSSYRHGVHWWECVLLTQVSCYCPSTARAGSQPPAHERTLCPTQSLPMHLSLFQELIVSPHFPVSPSSSLAAAHLITVVFLWIGITWCTLVACGGCVRRRYHGSRRAQASAQSCSTGTSNLAAVLLVHGRAVRDAFRRRP